MKYKKFQELLDDQVQWPEYYTFKFIIKEEQKANVMNILNDHEFREVPSRNGKYISITSKKYFQSSSEVIEVYQSLDGIDGLISL